MEGAGNIYTAETAIDSTQVPKNWRGYHGTDQLAPSIDACVITSSALAKAGSYQRAASCFTSARTRNR